MTQEKKQEFTLKITQANKTQLITILYEMVIEYLNDAIDAIGIGRKEEAEKSLGYAQNCIDELLRSLDLRYELARNLLTENISQTGQKNQDQLLDEDEVV